MLTLAELIDEYLAQHEASPVTLEKLRWLLRHAIAAFGGYRLDELRPEEISVHVDRGERLNAAAMDAGGRSVDVRTRSLRPSRQRNARLSRR